MIQELLNQSPWLIILEIVVGLVVCAFSCLVIYLHLQHQKYAHLPGPPLDNFFTGNIKSFVKSIEVSLHPGQIMLDLAEKYGKTFKFVLLNKTLVVTCDPELIKEILVSGNFEKPDDVYEQLGTVLRTRCFCNGLVTITDQKLYTRKRLFLNPWFQKSSIRNLADMFNECGDKMADRLSETADGKTKITMLDEFNIAALDVICKAAFGIDFSESKDNGMEDFKTAVFTTFRGIAEVVTNPFYSLNPKNWSDVKTIQNAIKFLRNQGTQIINDRRGKLTRGEYVPDDMLTILIKLEEQYPDIDQEEILDDFVTFFIAGQETSANLMAFMVLCLGQHPEVLERLLDEIASSVGDKPVLTFDDLDRLPYLDKVLKETLRLHPPVIATFRKVKSECTIGGYRIPAGTNLMPSFYAAFHTSDIFEDPMKFDPERFSSNNRVSPYTYFPFSLGPRTCIGKLFAEAETKIVIVKFLQRYKFELDPTQDFRTIYYSTNRPKGKVVCTLTPR